MGVTGAKLLESGLVNFGCGPMNGIVRHYVEEVDLRCDDRMASDSFSAISELWVLLMVLASDVFTIRAEL